VTGEKRIGFTASKGRMYLDKKEVPDYIKGKRRRFKIGSKLHH
jgi:hypothetical protein